MRAQNESLSNPLTPGHVADAAEVQAVLNQLAHALTHGDGGAAAGFWQAPAFVLGDEHEFAVSRPEEFEQFFGGAKEQYNARGITGTRADIVRLDWLTPRIALVTVRWPHLDANADEQGSETSTYVLRREASGALKLRVAIMHGEEAGTPARAS